MAHREHPAPRPSQRVGELNDPIAAAQAIGTKPFTWKNGLPDVYASFHRGTVAAYLRDIILPAVAALERSVK